MLGRHLLGYLPVQAAQAIVGFGGVAILTRLMPTDMYGRYALALTAMHLCGMGLFAWLDAAVARFHARSDRRGGLSGHLRTAYATFVVLAAFALVSGGMALWAAPISDELKTALGFALAALVIKSGLHIGQETRRAAGQVAAYSGLETLNLLLGFAVGIGLLLATPLGAAGPLAGMAIGSAVALVFGLRGQISKMKNGKARAKRAALYLAYGLPVSISLVFEHLLSAGDRFLIAGMLGESAVGIYAAGYGLADRTLDIIFIWLGAAAAPLTIAALEHNGMDAARALAGRTARIMGLIAFPAAAGLALVAAPLAGVMVGEEFRSGAITILPWIALAGLMNGLMTYYFHEAFTLKRKTGAMATIMAICAVANIGLNLIFLPLFGIVGAAAATVLAYGFGLVACAIVGRRIFALPLPWIDWGKAGLATAIMAAAVIAVPVPDTAMLALMIKAISGAVVYCTAALALDAAGCRAWIGDARALLKPAEATG
tara:strand:- start:567 stop:2024 length:1458 start_codon:yes stop_codon:yes gene_type:complete